MQIYTVVIIDPCSIATLDPTPDDNYSFNLEYGTVVNLAPAWTISEPNCPQRYLCSTALGEPDFCTVVSGALSVITFDDTSGDMSIMTDDYDKYPPGSYAITIEGSYIGFPAS